MNASKKYTTSSPATATSPPTTPPPDGPSTKRSYRKAAIAARDFASELSPLSPAVRRSRLAAIARAYSYQDSKLAYKMQEVCDEARRHLLVQRGKVELILKNRFNMDFEHTMQEVIHENSCNDSHPDTARVTDKSKNARSQRARTAASWSPFGKRVLLAGVLLLATTANPTGILLRDPALQNNALIAHWSKVFCDVPHFPEEKAKNISDKFGIDLKGIDLVLPSSECILKSLRRAKNSAPGPDGLPYAAWLACGDSGASTLHGILLDVCDGRIPATPFNDTNIVFLPKSDVCCPGGLIAAPGATRPLGLKNTDNKAIAATLASALASAISATASLVQQGFVRGRRFTDNIIEVDWAARRALEIPQNGPWGLLPVALRAPRTLRCTGRLPQRLSKMAETHHSEQRPPHRATKGSPLYVRKCFHHDIRRWSLEPPILHKIWGAPRLPTQRRPLCYDPRRLLAYDEN